MQARPNAPYQQLSILNAVTAVLFSDSVIRALAVGGAAVRCERW